MSDLPTWATDGQAPTPPLDEYLAAEKEDPSLFWWIGCGHHENLLAEAVAQRDAAREQVKVNFDLYHEAMENWRAAAAERDELRVVVEMAAQSYIQLEGELREVTALAGLNCAECGADISDYAEGLTLCAICDPDVDDK